MCIRFDTIEIENIVHEHRENIGYHPKLVCVLLCRVRIFEWIDIFKETFVLAPEQLQWQALEMGVLIHFNLETFGSSDFNSLDIPSPSIFDPYLLSTDNWVQTMVDFGAKEAVLVAKVSCVRQEYFLIGYFSMAQDFLWLQVK